MFDVKSAVGKSFVINILLTIFSIACIAQDLSECRFRELFEEGLKKCYRYRNPYGGIGLKSVPQALQDPNVGPFLAEVLRKGCTWLPRDKYSRHFDRCYAAVCLGTTRDSRALAPLIDALRDVDEKEKCKFREYLSAYAARGLALLKDPNAFDALLEALEDKRPPVKRASAHALANIGDIRAVKLLIEKFNDEDLEQGFTLHECLKKLTRKRDFKKWQYSKDRKKVFIPEFPVLGVVEGPGYGYKQYWRYWWQKGQEHTRQRFEAIHSEWRNLKKETEAQKNLARRKFNNMSDLGIAALPFMIEKVQEGDTIFIPVISRLTDGQLKKTATKEDCLDWWNKNKGRWLIPFEKPT